MAEFNFDLDRMKLMVESGVSVIPPGLNFQEFMKWVEYTNAELQGEYDIAEVEDIHMQSATRYGW